MRVATVPTAAGERVTIRLLDRSSVLLGLPDIGFAQDILATRSATSSRGRTASSWSPAHRLRQDDHALRLPVRDQHARPQHPHRRGSGRVPARGHLADPGQPEDRPDLRQRAALVPAPGSRRHHGRRDPRPRDRRDRDHRLAHRSPRVLDGPHQRRGRRASPAWSTWASSRSSSPRRWSASWPSAWSAGRACECAQEVTPSHELAARARPRPGALLCRRLRAAAGQGRAGAAAGHGARSASAARAAWASATAAGPASTSSS